MIPRLRLAITASLLLLMVGCSAPLPATQGTLPLAEAGGATASRPGAAQASPAPATTPGPVRLLVSRDVLDALGPQLRSLSTGLPGLAVSVDDDAIHAPNDATARLLWSHMPPDDALPVRREPYCAIVNVRQWDASWTRAELVALVSSTSTWRQMMQGDAGVAVPHLLGVSPPGQAVSVEGWLAAKEHVATHPSAWSIVPWSVVDHRVRPVPIDGVQPGPSPSADYALWRTLFLTHPEELPPEFLSELERALEYHPSPSLSLVAVGDIMLARNVGQRMAPDAWRSPFEGRGIADLLQNADIAFGNLECALSDAGEQQLKAYTFRADPRAIQGLAFAGFDVLSLANNHTGDYGPVSLSDTLRHLRTANISPVGAGATSAQARAPVVIWHQGLRLAFLAYNAIGPRWLDATDTLPGAAFLSVDDMVADVRAAQRVADLVIVSCHWGIEYRHEATAAQTQAAQALADAGAALVIGHHPHVLQGLDYHERSLTTYSLGNFVFDMGTAPRSEGVALRCLLDISGVKTAELVPYRIVDGQPRLLQTAQGESIVASVHRLTAQQRRYPR